MTEKVTLEILTKSRGDTGSGTTTGSKKNDFLGAISGISKIALGVGAVITIAKDMFWAFKPLLNIIKGVSKMLGQFLQPIAEVLTILLMPILQLLTPILEAFKSMMAPFMVLIRRLGIISKQQAASGDTEGLMGTSALITETLFAPMFTVLANLVGNKLFDFVGVVGNLLIDGIYEALRAIGSVIDKIFHTDLTSQLVSARADTKATLSNSLDILKTTLDTGTSIMLEDLYTNLSNKVDVLGATLPQKMDVNIVKPFEDLVDKLSAVVKRKSSSRHYSRSTSISSALSNPKQSYYRGSGNVLSDVRNPLAAGGILNPI